jgi:CRP-like cAMP-binding protein
MITIKDLEHALSIDKNAIDEALLQQPDLFYRVSQQLAEAISLRDASKQKRDETEAEIDFNIRRLAETANQKTTESKIENEKRLNQKVIEASNELGLHNKEVNKWAALKEAYIQRSHALKSLVELYIAGYFGSTVSNASERMKDNRAETNMKAMAAIREKQRKSNMDNF